MRRYIVGITGASGSILAKRVLELMPADVEVHLIATDNGRGVFAYETGLSLENLVDNLTSGGKSVVVHDNGNLFADVASGSFAVDGMAVVPCSMATVGKLAGGAGDSLLCRAADVCLKEDHRLVLVAREAPLHQIHLENLLKLSRCGAVILPPVPQFYQKVQTYEAVVDGIAGRILKAMGIENDYYTKWRNPL